MLYCCGGECWWVGGFWVGLVKVKDVGWLDWIIFGYNIDFLVMDYGFI